MKVLIVGAKGQLGNELCRTIKEKSSPIGVLPDIFSGCQLVTVDSDELNITDQLNVVRYVETVNPEIIVNCAAYTNVDACEKNQELAFQVNALGPRNLAIAAEQTGAGLLHISTDYVFDGKKTVPYRETDLCNPQNIYGQSKYLGEQYVRQFCKKYTIVRTAWLYSYAGTNFVKTIIKAAQEKGHLKVVDDQYGNPTNAADLSYHILKLAAAREYGVFHCTGSGECSWYDFACEIVQRAKVKCTIEACTSAEYKRGAQRPEFSSLDNFMLRCTVGDRMRPWKDALRDFIDCCYRKGAYK